MKPLTKNEIGTFLKRFDDFKGAEINSLDIISPSVIQITFATQDSARGFDWVALTLQLSGVSDAKIPESSKLPYIDMSEGITLLYYENSFFFALGAYENLRALTSSLCIIQAASIQYEENLLTFH